MSILGNELKSTKFGNTYFKQMDYTVDRSKDEEHITWDQNCCFPPPHGRFLRLDFHYSGLNHFMHISFLVHRTIQYISSIRLTHFDFIKIGSK